jgi:hypothetical protein
MAFLAAASFLEAAARNDPNWEGHVNMILIAGLAVAALGTVLACLSELRFARRVAAMGDEQLLAHPRFADPRMGLQQVQRHLEVMSAMTTCLAAVSAVASAVLGVLLALAIQSGVSVSGAMVAMPVLLGLTALYSACTSFAHRALRRRSLRLRVSPPAGASS